MTGAGGDLVHAWYFDMQEDSKAPTAEVDEEVAVF